MKRVNCARAFALEVRVVTLHIYDYGTLSASSNVFFEVFKNYINFHHDVKHHTFFSQVEKDDPYKEFIILLKIKCSNFLKQNFQPKKCGYVESQNFLRNYLSFII